MNETNTNETQTNETQTNETQTNETQTNETQTNETQTIHTCRPTAATYVPRKWCEAWKLTPLVKFRYPYAVWPFTTISANYYRLNRQYLKTYGDAFATLLHHHGATRATIDPLVVLEWLDHHAVALQGNLNKYGVNILPVFLGERAAQWPEAVAAAAVKQRTGEHERVVFEQHFSSKLEAFDEKFQLLNRMHYVHWSKKFPGQVAYAESFDRLAADRWTTCKPGRYLTKYYADVLNENEIRDMVQRLAASQLPAELHYIESNDPDGWVRVYANGPDSCMSGDDSVRVYAHDKSVLRLAYLTQNGEITARCIVREDDKEWIRCYPNPIGDEGTKWHTLMKSMVERAGYTRGNLRGVLLAAERTSRYGDGSYVCPYIDCGNDDSLCADLVYIKGKEYLQLGDSGGTADNTNGTVDVYGDTRECDHCGDRVDEEEMTYVENHGDICPCCIDNEFKLAMGLRHEEYVRNEDAIYCESDGCYYIETEANNHAVYQCEVSSEWYSLDDLCRTLDGYVVDSLCVELDVDDADGNSYAASSAVTATHDGRTIRTDESCIWFGKVCHMDDDPDELNETNETNEEGVE